MIKMSEESAEEKIFIGVMNSMAQLTIIALMGFTLRKKGLVNDKMSKSLSEAVKNLFLPCLLFANVTGTFSLDEFYKWLPLILFAIAHTAIGCLLGYVVGRFIIRLKGDALKYIVACMGFGHTTSIELLMIASLTSVLQLVSGEPEDETTASARALSYILVFTIFITIFRWTIGYGLLEKTEEDLEQPLLEGGDLKQVKDQEQGNETASEKKTMSLTDKLKASLNTPVYVALLSLFIASVPPLKNLFFGDNAIFYNNVVMAAQGCGRAVYPIVIVILGFTLAMPKEQFRSDAGCLEISAATFARLVIMPVIGFFTIMPLYKSGFIADPMMAFVLLVEFTTPTAINLLVMATLHQHHESRMAKLLLYQYVIGLFTLTAWSYFYLETIKTHELEIQVPSSLWFHVMSSFIPGCFSL